MRSVPTTVAVLAALLALPAFATGERIHIASSGAASDQLKETLCFSMECQSSKDGVEVIVTARAVGGSIELKVVSPDGTVRLSQRVAAEDEGRFGSTDLVSSTTKIFKSIEQPQLAREEAAAEKANAERAQAEKLAASQAKVKQQKTKALAKQLKGKKGKLLAAR
jgi:hypothetical protein